MRASLRSASRSSLAVLLALAFVGCVGDAGPVDAGAPRDAGGAHDAGLDDAGGRDAASDAAGHDDVGAMPDGGSRYAMAEAPLPLGGCTIFPRETVFHADIRALPVHPRSAEWIAFLGESSALRLPSVPVPMVPLPPLRYGVPINRADASTPRMRVEYNGVYAIERQYGGPFPKPSPFAIQDGFDQHTVVLETSECASYELIGATDFFGVLRALGGARVDLGSHDYLPRAHSVTAPGLSNLATLLRADEVRAGRIDHVMLFSMPRVKSTEPLWPAKRTDGIATEADAIPMGAWLRLRADFDLAPLPRAAQIVARALQRHGLLLGDTGGVADALVMRIEKSDLYVDAAGRSVEADLHAIQDFVTAGDFEVIDAAPMQVDPESLRIR
jgi:hypothetical protein